MSLPAEQVHEQQPVLAPEQQPQAPDQATQTPEPAASTAKDDEAPMQPSKTVEEAGQGPHPLACWDTVPVEMDGWKISHDAIRLDMTDLRQLLEGPLAQHITTGKTQAWMGSNLKKWVDKFHHTVHEHHDHEEEIFFPAINKKVELPPKMTTDHAHLMELLDQVRSEAAALSDALLQRACAKEMERCRVVLLQTLQRLEADMRPHLAEEEDLGIPIFRANFTREESKALEAQILKTIKKIEVGWFLRAMPEERRREWMRDIAGMPGPVVRFIFWPIAKKGGKYDRTYTRLLDEITAGERKSGGNCVIS